MAHSIIFDIETGPLSDGELERIAPPFQPLAVNGSEIIGQPFDKSAVKLGRLGSGKEFDPKSVRLGKTTDPQKVAEKIGVARELYAAKVAEVQDGITAKIESARVKYAADVKVMVAKVEAARIKHWEGIAGKAALKALTGKVLAIGYLGPKGGLKGISGGEEPAILLKFWDIFQEQVDRGNRMVGFNIFGFDLPFLIRRSWILGLSFPFRFVRDGRYWNSVFIDLMAHWQLGVYQEYVSLDAMAKSLGVGAKTEGVSGADFARLWAEDRAKAKAYLANDLTITRACAAKLGCLIEGEI